MTYTATYSPDDNKLRLYASSRLDAETYARVKAAGFSWAPKQEVFVAPMWTPERADLCEELAGEIGDEDTSLAERAEARAERFEDYSDKRQADAEQARAAVASIADGIPMGQPILVGHHSEKHARRDAEKIENGMRRAVKMWETSKYWTERAAGALRHAKYKELPAVRARRIKGLEAEERKLEKSRQQSADHLRAWTIPGLSLELARQLANVASLRVGMTTERPEGWTAWDVLRPDGERYAACPAWTVERVQEAAQRVYPRSIERCDRWLEHYRNRLAYERAMLAEAGGLVSDRQQFAVGGRVLRRGQWYVVTRVNAGSVSVSGHWGATITHDEIQEYQPPTAEETAKVAKATKLAPLCNYPGEGFVHLTRAELDARKERRWSDFPKIGRINPTETTGAHRVHQCRGTGQWSIARVFVTDEKRKDPPQREPEENRPDFKPVRQAPQVEAAPAADLEVYLDDLARTVAPDADVFEAMKQSLKAGVQVVSAPQLFPTPVELARRMVEEAGLESGQRILEPSAGTGRLIDAVAIATDWDVSIVAVEQSAALHAGLCTKYNGHVDKRQADFLACRPGDPMSLFSEPGDLGTFDRIIMNPPFGGAQDIQHIQHARAFLKPGGRLVALCANGPRQRTALEPIASTWEDLPAGSFQSEGTGVNVALLVIEAPV